MPHEFQITRRVEFSETDMAGIMHFSNFFRFMEAAETAFLRLLGYSVALPRGGINLCLPRVHAECDYLAPLRFEDEVLVRLLVERKGTSSLTYQFRFHRLDGDSQPEVARGRLTLVCTAPQADGTLKAVPLPESLARVIQEAPAELLEDGRANARVVRERASGPGESRAEGAARGGLAGCVETDSLATSAPGSKQS